MWKTILTCQHHDIYCFSAPELRQKAIGWLLDAENEASRMVSEAGEAVAGSIATFGLAGQVVALF